MYFSGIDTTIWREDDSVRSKQSGSFNRLLLLSKTSTLTSVLLLFCVDVTVVDLRVIISWPASASPRFTLLPTNIRNILIKSSHSNSPVSRTNSQILLTFFDFSLDSHHYTRTDLLASSIRKQKHSCTEAAACFVLPAHTQPQALP